MDAFRCMGLGPLFGGGGVTPEDQFGLPSVEAAFQDGVVIEGKGDLFRESTAKAFEF